MTATFAARGEGSHPLAPCGPFAPGGRRLSARPSAPWGPFADAGHLSPVSAAPGGAASAHLATRGNLASGRGVTAGDAPVAPGAVPVASPAAAGFDPRVDTTDRPVTLRRVTGRPCRDIERHDRGCGACPPAHPSPVVALGALAAVVPQPAVPPTTVARTPGHPHPDMQRPRRHLRSHAGVGVTR